MEPEDYRPRDAAKLLVASVLHVAIVAVLAPSLILAPLIAIREQSLIVVPMMVWLTFIFSWWFTIPVAVATCVCYAASDRIRRASVVTHVLAWALIGGLSAHTWTLLAHVTMTPILAFDGMAALSGAAIGFILFKLWRLPTARVRIAKPALRFLPH